MFQFIKDNDQYSQLRKRIVEKAIFQIQEFDQTPENLLTAIFEEFQLGSLPGVRVGNRSTILRTPAQLKPLLEKLLSMPSELSAWLVRFKIERAIQALHLPMELQGDILMAFEVANYILPDKLQAASRHLAFQLCLLPTLGRARATLANLGIPYMEEGANNSAIKALIKHGYLPEDVRFSSQIGWNAEIRENVMQEVSAITPDAARLFQFEKIIKNPPPALQRMGFQPDPAANDLLRKAIEEKDLHKSFEMFTQAGNLYPRLLTDVYRNQAWILAKWGQYGDAVELCRKALDLDPKYDEVWYHLGICLAKLQSFTQALEAFENAKALGFKKDGLEPNIATCRRAIKNGLR